MSGRFQGKWPTDKAGNPLKVTIAAYPYNEDSHKMALTRAGRNPNQKSKGQKTLIEPGSKNSNRAAAPENE